MPNIFDTIVVGLGAMGSATAYHLASQDANVLGLDQFLPPHTLGSSHGRSRIIREAYFEDPAYVPLVQRAYDLWHELEQRGGQPLFQQTGGLMIGRPSTLVFSGAKRSAQQHGLSHEILSAPEIRRRFPALCPTDEMLGVWEPRAGILAPEACIQTHLHLARQHGAELRLDESVSRWQPDGTGVRVTTPRGSYSAQHLIFTVGAWLGRLVPELNLPLQIERQVLFWFEPLADPNQFTAERCPIHLWEHDAGKYFYGFPDTGDGVKVARHHEGEITTPQNLRREISDADEQSVRAAVRQFLPKANGPLKSATVCLYTNTPDSHFLIDHHPNHPQVLIGSPCSGHGFKFSSAIGEALADLSLGKQPKCDLNLFRLDRLLQSRP